MTTAKQMLREAIDIRISYEISMEKVNCLQDSRDGEGEGGYDTECRYVLFEILHCRSMNKITRTAIAQMPLDIQLPEISGAKLLLVTGKKPVNALLHELPVININ